MTRQRYFMLGLALKGCADSRGMIYRDTPIEFLLMRDGRAPPIYASCLLRLDVTHF